VSEDQPPGESGEDRLIATYFRALATDPGAFGLTDDAAILTPPPGSDVVLKTDPIICGVHFFPEDPAEAVARKALRVNLSDLAAKGAKPAGFLLALALPADTGKIWLAAFAEALGADAARYGCPLLGGDTDRTPGPLTVSIAAFGTLPHGTMVRRNGAKPGDRVVVTGTIGDASLGLRLRQAGSGGLGAGLASAEHAYLLARYLIPEPRCGIAEALRAHASAAMDISDGLAGDLGKLCRASHASAEIDVGLVPLSDAGQSLVSRDNALIETVLTGGDDYEILCTVAPDRLERFRALASAAGISTTEIGRVVAGWAPPRFLDRSGRPLVFEHPSFSHF